MSAIDENNAFHIEARDVAERYAELSRSAETRADMDAWAGCLIAALVFGFCYRSSEPVTALQDYLRISGESVPEMVAAFVNTFGPRDGGKLN